MREKSRFQNEDTHSRVKPHSGTNNMQGGERCAFCSWKYSCYFELLKKKHTHIQMLDQVPARPGQRILMGNISWVVSGSGLGKESKVYLHSLAARNAGGGDESTCCRWDGDGCRRAHNAGGHDGGTAVGGTGACKLGTERVGSAPLTSVNGLFRYPDFTIECQSLPQKATTCHRMPEPVTECHRMPQHAAECQSLPQNATTCRRMPEPATECHNMPQNARICHGIPRQ